MSSKILIFFFPPHIPYRHETSDLSQDFASNGASQTSIWDGHLITYAPRGTQSRLTNLNNFSLKHHHENAHWWHQTPTRGM